MTALTARSPARSCTGLRAGGGTGHGLQREKSARITDAELDAFLARISRPVFVPAATLAELRRRYGPAGWVISVAGGRWRARTGKHVSYAYDAPSLERSIREWSKLAGIEVRDGAR